MTILLMFFSQLLIFVGGIVAGWGMRGTRDSMNRDRAARP